MKNKRLLTASIITYMLFSTPTLTANAAYDPSSVMDLLIETTSPSDVSIQVGDTYYNLKPLDYNNAEAINPTSYERGRITTSYYKWEALEDGSRALVENTDQSGSDLTITRITNPQHSRQKSNLGGADLTGQIFINQTNNSQNGGAIINSSGFSIGDITAYFVNNHTPKNHGGAIYNDGSISSIAGDFIENYVEITGNGFGGAISNLDGTIGAINSNFIGNYVDASGDVHGGAIHNANTITSINGDFIYNTSSSENSHSYGGAISNRQGGKIDEISGNFIGNYTYNTANAAADESQNLNALGGAISNIQDGTRIDSISGSFIANYAESENNIAKGGAIFNSTGTASIGEIIGGFVGNYVKGDRGAYGGAIHNNTGNDSPAIESIDGIFKGNYANSASGDALGGAIYNENTSDNPDNLAYLGNISGSFESNYVLGETAAKGGAIYNSKGIIDSIEADFIDNYAQSTGSGAFGGAVYNNIDAEIVSINGTFTRNHITPKSNYAYGGSIYNAGIIDEIKGTFEGNYINTTISGMGGAIANGLKTNSVTESGLIGLIEADFYGNYVISTSDVHGGAIQNGGSEITTINGDFLENYTQSSNNHSYGGAIANRRNGKISSISGVFDDNHVINSANYSATGNKNAHGGAIANYQDTSTISYIEGTFTNNYALAQNNAAKGGAIYNATENATIDEISAAFDNNSAEGATGAYGGAIFNSTGTATKARIGSITGDFNGNHSIIIDSSIDAVKEAFGGAIYNANTTTGANNIAHIGDISGSFTDNYVIGNIAQGGAIYNSKAIIDSIVADFSGNCTNSYTDALGGAIYNNNAKIGYIEGDFDGNNSQIASTQDSADTIGAGGAIFNIDGTIGDITGDFSNNYVQSRNSSADGGAITNVGSVIGAVTGDFTNNYAIGSDQSKGGAIYNENGDITFIDASFTNNASSGIGGAICNYVEDPSVNSSTINIIADSKDVEFTGNKSYAEITVNSDDSITVNGDNGNAVYNDHGIINLNAKEGTSITFNDEFTGDFGVININKEDAYITLDSDLNEIIKDIDQIGGDYIFNSIIDCNKIYLYNGGKIILGESANMELDGFVNDNNGGTLDAANGVAQGITFNATELNSDLNFNMDLDLTDMSDIQSDTISVDGAESYGNIVLSDINLVGKAIVDFTEDTEITQRVLYGNDEYTTISLGDDVLDTFNATYTTDIHGSEEWTGPNIQWNDEFGGYTITRTIESEISVTGSDGNNVLQDSLLWSIDVEDSDPVITDKADNLALVNHYQTTEDRNFNFDSGSNVFQVTQDSGVTAGGKLIINGVSDEQGTSTINGTDEQGVQHNLFELTSGNETIVEINNTKITGANTVATVSGGNTLTLNNVEISGNTNGIVNDSNLNLNGENIIADNITNATGGGIMSVLSGTTNILGSANVDQNTLQTESGTELNIAGTVSVADKFNNQGDINITDTGALNLNGNNLDITGNITNNNQLNINGSAANSGLIENNGEMTTNNNFTNGNSITGTGSFTHKSGDLVNNSLIEQNNFNNEGTVLNNNTINAQTVNNSGTITTNADNLISNSIANSGTLNLTGGTTQGDISGNGTTNINGSIFIDNQITGNTLNLNSGMLAFTDNADISQANVLNVNGGGINAGDGEFTNTNLGDVNLNNQAALVLDFDLTNLTSDTFDANITNNGGIFNVSDINFTGSPIQDNIHIHLGDTTNLGRENVTSDYFELPTIMTPIRRLSGSLSNGWLNFGGTGNSFKDFNPSVMASPVASLVGGFLTQSQVLQDSFYHMDRYTKYTQSQRMAAENVNKYADVTNAPVYTKSSLPELSSAMWVKPYTTFESVDLKNGTGVSNVSYGMLYGGDTDLVDIGRGYKGIISAFIGYNGSHQSYNGIDMNQQGGTLGVTGTLYKGNFFTGLTISAGASGGEAFTTYGTDRFSMLTAGIANKTGYNIEIAQGKLIIQPSLFLGYTFANTFDYTNSAGVKIKSDPLNAIQVAPGIKLIGNLENGWQPYLGVDMMWNIMGKTDFTANQTQLPNMSVKPYVQYGAGVQKSWGQRFTAFFQTMLRNGGRTGVVLQAGFRWTFGKNTPKSDTAKTKKVIKQIN